MILNWTILKWKKRVITVLKSKYYRKKAEKNLDRRTYNKYLSNLRNKTFFAWRNVIYKAAFEMKLLRTSKKEVNGVQEEYIKIMQTLKQKINETEELIRIKKGLKAEFAYSLSKNMLKTISNLSMEVMNLNQVSLKDQKMDVSYTTKFLDDLNNMIEGRTREVQHLKQTINDEVVINVQYGPKRITF